MTYLSLRLLSSFLAGMILSQTGSLLQLGTRNILSSPSTLGIDGLAVLWFLISYSVFLLFGIGLTPMIGLPIAVIFGLMMAKAMSGRNQFEKVILIGISFNLLVGAIFSVWQFLFLALNLSFPAELWFGNFRQVEASYLWWLVIVELIIFGGFLTRFKDLQLFSLGSEVAQNWELQDSKLFKYIFVAVSVGTFVVINLFGVFSFIGLIFPILARKIWFKRHDLEGEFIYGSISNGIILMLLDAVCYFFPFYGAEIPVGMIVTALGAVSLIVLLWFNNKNSEMVEKAKK